MTAVAEAQSPSPETSANHTSTATEAPSFRPDIEGLRAVAVLLVVLGHAGLPFLSGGYVGVDVFFVISGFLITSLLLAEKARTGAISIRKFYARRAARLLPAAALVVVSTLAAAWLWLPGTRFTSIAGDAFASGLYSMNFRLAIQNTDYLTADAPPSPLQHFWSLAVEEQFYFVWPVLLILLTLTAARRGRISRLPVALTLAAIAAVSLVLSVTQTATSAPWAYFGVQARAWELAAGALLAVFAASAARIAKPVAASLAWLGLAAIMFSAVAFDEATAFPGYLAVVPVLGTVMVIAAGCGGRGGADSVLGLKPMQLIGKLSYGWYLWHWPVLLIAPAALGRDGSIKLNLVLVVAALGLTAVSYKFLENPIRTRKSLKTRPWRGLALGASLSAGIAVVAVCAAFLLPPPLGKGEADDIAEQYSQQPIDEAALTEHLAAALREQNVPANLTPALDRADNDKPVLYNNGCHLDFEVIDEPENSCVFGDPEGDKTVVLSGDSHAAQWHPAFDALAKQNGWRLISVTKSGCPPTGMLTYNTELNREYNECPEWRDTWLSEVRDLNPDLVVMTSGEGSGIDDPDEQWADGWAESFGMVDDGNAKLVFLADTPWHDESVPDCLASNIDNADACTRSQDEASPDPKRRDKITETLTEQGVHVVDPTQWFCVEGECPVIVENMLVFRDRHHITTDYARLISPLLEDELSLS
ncbi:MAG: acyltransferase family protein [Stackebrandtia sp.]